jgi:hypothetical protein
MKMKKNNTKMTPDADDDDDGNGGGREGGREGERDEFPDKMYAMVLEFSHSPDYVPIRPIRLPFLAKPPPSEALSEAPTGKGGGDGGDRGDGEEGEEGKEGEVMRFPHMYKLVLNLQPLAPVRFQSIKLG